jgi:hypothetical protein
MINLVLGYILLTQIDTHNFINVLVSSSIIVFVSLLLFYIIHVIFNKGYPIPQKYILEILRKINRQTAK